MDHISSDFAKLAVGGGLWRLCILESMDFDTLIWIECEIPSL